MWGLLCCVVLFAVASCEKNFDFVFEPNCYDFPGRDFSPYNYAVEHYWLTRDDVAPPFELQDVRTNESVNLEELLKTKPVFLQFASYTCPNYRSMIDPSNKLYKQYYKDVHFVVVYVPEAHPSAPDVAPYRGYVSEGPWSHYGQLKTYAERVEAAIQVADLHTKGTIFLIDTLTTVKKESNQIVWCQYGPAPNPGYVINQNGIVEAGMEWMDPEIIEKQLVDLINSSNSPLGKISAEAPIEKTSKGSSDAIAAIVIVLLVIVISLVLYFFVRWRKRRRYQRLSPMAEVMISKLPDPHCRTYEAYQYQTLDMDP